MAHDLGKNHGVRLFLVVACGVALLSGLSLGFHFLVHWALHSLIKP